MPKLRVGIASIGGKFRLVNTILNFVPYHEFFLSLFCGACWVEINQPRSRYECWNDRNSETINYLLMVRQYPKEFDEMKQGVFGLVSQEICNRIVRGEIKPQNNLERGFLFYYLNKLTFAGDVKKIGDDAHYSGIQNPCINSIRETDLEKAKERFDDNVHANYGGLGTGVMGSKEGRFPRKNDVEQAKDEYKTKGYAGMNQNRIDSKEIEKAKSTYRGIVPDGSLVGLEDFNAEKTKASYTGINNTRALGPSGNKRDRAKWQQEFQENAENANYRGIAEKDGLTETTSKQYQTVSHESVSGYKGINPIVTRPYTNFDRGLLTPLQPEAIERLRFVNITCYDFRKVYKLFYKAFYERKGLSKECFIYGDPPFPGSEHYYGNLFKKEDHQDLIDLMLKTPFNFMLSMGGECEMYLKQLKDWNIVPLKVKYSMDANNQYDRNEYLIMNYEIKKSAKMTNNCQGNITKFF